MKTAYKLALSIALSALVSVFTTPDALAQRGGHGGGGGGFHGGGGGGFHGGGGFSGGGGRSFGGFSGGSRPSFGGGNRGSYSGNRVMTAPQRGAFGGGRAAVAPRGGFGYNRGGIGVAPGRGNYGYRPGVGARGYAYRGGVGGRGFAYRPGYGYGGGRGFYHYYGGFYNRSYFPRIGFSLGVLPYGYYPFWYGNYQYYYSDGYFYQYDNNQYTVVEPPVGAEINKLPEDAQSIVIDGQQYYELNGVYYQAVTKEDGTLVYVVAGKDGKLDTGNGGAGDPQQDGGNYPRIGDVVNNLPPDTHRVKMNGQKYFVSPDGVYYQEQRDSNGNKIYVVAGLPDDEDDAQGQPQQ